MATAAVTNTFVNATPADAADVNQNFTDLVTFLNNSVMHVDGTRSMTNPLGMGAWRVTNVGAATAGTDAPQFRQSGFGEMETSSGTTVLPAGVATTIDQISVTLPAAGMALIVCRATVVSSGVTPPGLGAYTGTLTVTGGSWTGTPVTSEATTLDANGSTTFTFFTFVGLPSGSTTLDVKLERNGTGGTATVQSGVTTALIGAF